MNRTFYQRLGLVAGNGLAPPKGWNDWNAFQRNAGEQDAKLSASWDAEYTKHGRGSTGAAVPAHATVAARVAGGGTGTPGAAQTARAGTCPQVPGTKAETWPCLGQASRQWQLHSDGTLTGAQPGLRPAVTGASTANGTPAQPRTSGGQPDQQ